MATKLYLWRTDDAGRMERRTVMVPRCPMFDFDNENDTAEVKALVAQGFKPSGHVDDYDKEHRL